MVRVEDAGPVLDGRFASLPSVRALGIIFRWLTDQSIGLAATSKTAPANAAVASLGPADADL